MRILFSPQRRDDALTVVRAGDALTINGETFDFSSLPDGATVPEVPCDWIAGPVERVNGVLHLTLVLPHGPSPSPAVAFPEPIMIATDGPIELPHDEEAADVDA